MANANWNAKAATKWATALAELEDRTGELGDWSEIESAARAHDREGFKAACLVRVAEIRQALGYDPRPIEQRDLFGAA